MCAKEHLAHYNNITQDSVQHEAQEVRYLFKVINKCSSTLISSAALPSSPPGLSIAALSFTDTYQYLNDLSCRSVVLLLCRPLRERRKFLDDNMVEVPNRILFSEMKHVTVRRNTASCLRLAAVDRRHHICVHVFQRAGDLADMITRVIREGLEGLVLKDIKVSGSTNILTELFIDVAEAF